MGNRVTKRRNIVMGDKTWAKLKELAADEERSASDLIREAVTDLFLKKARQRNIEYDPVKDSYSQP